MPARQTPEPVPSERTPLISFRGVTRRPNATKLAGGGEHPFQHIGRGSFKTALYDRDVEQRAPCVRGFINPSGKTLHVFPALQRKTGEVTFRTPEFCSSRMLQHNRAADGRYRCVRSLVFCRCFLKSVARLAFMVFLPGMRRIPSCAMTQKAFTFCAPQLVKAIGTVVF